VPKEGLEPPLPCGKRILKAYPADTYDTSDPDYAHLDAAECTRSAPKGPLRPGVPQDDRDNQCQVLTPRADSAPSASDPVREALAYAVRRAADAGRWDVVRELATLGLGASEDAPAAAQGAEVIILEARRGDG
jgi:hypothetical protein